MTQARSDGHAVETRAYLLNPIVWLLGQERVVLAKDLCSTLGPYVRPEMCLAAYERWASSRTAAHSKISNGARQEEQGRRLLVEAALNQLHGEGLCEVRGRGRQMEVRRCELGDVELTTQIEDMEYDAHQGVLAGFTLLEGGQRHPVDQLRDRVASAVSMRWGDVAHDLLTAHAMGRIEAESSYQTDGEGADGQAWFGDDRDHPLEGAPRGGEADVGPGGVAQGDAGTGHDDAPATGTAMCGPGVEPPYPGQPLGSPCGAGPDAVPESKSDAPGLDGALAAREIRIDPEFAQLIRRHSDEEEAQLKTNLLQAGTCRDPLVLWKGHMILLEGHLRFALCQQHGISFSVVEIDLPDREAAKAWMVDNQRGRRNLTPEEDSYYRGLKYNAGKRPHGGDRKRSRSSAQGEHLKTAEKLAVQEGVSPATVRRDGDFAEATDRLSTACGDALKQEILSGESGLTRQEVIGLAREEDPAVLRKTVEERQRERGKPKGDQKATRDKASKKTLTAGPDTLTVPTEPKALAKTLMDTLGHVKAGQVHRALSTLLRQQGQGQSKGQKPHRKAPGRKKGGG